jgi:hypothetical protein
VVEPLKAEGGNPCHVKRGEKPEKGNPPWLMPWPDKALAMFFDILQREGGNG